MQTLLISILLMASQQAPGKDLEQYRDFNRCKEEMQKAWLEYTKHAMRICGDCTYSRLENGQAKTWFMYNVIADGQSWKLSIANTSRLIEHKEFNTVAIARNHQNHRQLIWLDRKSNQFKNEDFWVISTLNSRNLEDESGETIPFADDPKLQWKGHPACLPLRMTHKYAVSINEFFESPAFELTGLTSYVLQNRTVVKVSFSIKSLDDPKTRMTYLGDGWIELLPKQYWVVHRAELLIKNDSIDSNRPDRLWRIENHYDPASPDVPVIRTIKAYTIDDKSDTKLPHLEELGQTTFQLSDKKLSEEDLSLSPMV